MSPLFATIRSALNLNIAGLLNELLSALTVCIDSNLTNLTDKLSR
jgi:hypothetical protein